MASLRCKLLGHKYKWTKGNSAVHNERIYEAQHGRCQRCPHTESVVASAKIFKIGGMNG